MKFFIPELEGDAETDWTLAAIAQFVGAQIPPPAKRIRKIKYRHNGKKFTAEVGKPVDGYYQEKADTVIVIVGQDPVCICLPFRGVVGGTPILVGKTSVERIEYFEV